MTNLREAIIPGSRRCLDGGASPCCGQRDAERIDPNRCGFSISESHDPAEQKAFLKVSRSLLDAESEQPEWQSANELFAAHAPFVAKFLWRMGAPDHEIEDLVQDVFLIAHLRGGFTRGRAQASTWLASIAFRVWSSERRRFRRHSELPNDEALARARSRGPTPIEAFAAAESVKRIRSVLEQIDERSRAILILVDLDGASGVEVAEVLGIPVGTVYSRLHSARKRFAAAYEKLGKEHGEEPHER